jgi:prepilin-type N-terminal cleavage/methylation domain-containing protein
MNKNKGFTMIEVMVVTIILLTLAAVVFNFLMIGKALNKSLQSNNTVTDVAYGVNGITEMRCIGGYKFITGDGGRAVQVMDEFGHGVRCGNNNKNDSQDFH